MSSVDIQLQMAERSQLENGRRRNRRTEESGGILHGPSHGQSGPFCLLNDGLPSQDNDTYNATLQRVEVNIENSVPHDRSGPLP